jgi:hypothetical protein
MRCEALDLGVRQLRITAVEQCGHLVMPLEVGQQQPVLHCLTQCGSFARVAVRARPIASQRGIDTAVCSDFQLVDRAV